MEKQEGLTENAKIKTNDNFILDGIFTKVENSPKGIVFAHGMSVDRDHEGIFVKAEPKLNNLGFSTLRFDFRAHGKSQGNSIKDFTISGWLEDLKAVFDFMKKQGINWLGLSGASVGGSVSALYAGSHPKLIKRLFLANPPLNYEKAFLNPTTTWAKERFKNIFEQINKKGFFVLGTRKFKMGRSIFEEMKIYHPCESLKKYHNPLMIVHGDHDNKLAYQDVIECFESLPSTQKRLEIIKGAKHGFHEEPYQTQVVEMIVNFFK